VSATSVRIFFVRTNILRRRFYKCSMAVKMYFVSNLLHMFSAVFRGTAAPAVAGGADLQGAARQGSVKI